MKFGKKVDVSTQSLLFTLKQKYSTDQTSFDS